MSKKIDLNRECFRAMIFYHLHSKQQCMERITLRLLVGETPKTRIYCWFQEFNSGHGGLSDNFHEGRLPTAVVPENIDAIARNDRDGSVYDIPRD